MELAFVLTQRGLHAHLRAGGSLRAREGRAIRARTTRAARHAQVVRGRRGRAIGSTNARVVLRAAPAETDARVTNGVALHLVDGHLSSMAVDELDEATALARGDLDIGDFTESLEEGAKLILGNVAREATNKDGRVVRVGELVHLGGRVKATAAATSAAGVGETSHSTTTPHLLLRHAAAHHRVAVMTMTSEAMVVVATWRQH